MSIVFSDTSTNLGIVQQTRVITRTDSNQWPTYNIVNSCNNWHDEVTGYAIGADKRFQWDDTNHSKLPEGTAQLTINVSDYSFLTDEQNNPIITLLGVSILKNGVYVPLQEVDRKDPNIDLSTFGAISGTPTQYDKIADNVIRLDRLPPATVSAGLKFYFQRTGSYFAATDTTKTPGVAPLLHRGYVIASAYDCAMTLGLDNLGVLRDEKQMERLKMIQYFGDRNNDTTGRMVVGYHSSK